MLRSRIYHWNCSKFADFIRGEKKPYALEWNKWTEWRDQQKKKRPIRYWLAEKGLSKLQNFFSFPLDIYCEVKYYIRNRWIDKTHYFQTGLEPGHYYEFDHRLLHALFNELVIFVETEYASMAKHNSINKKKKNYKFKNGRCSEAGLDYLNWESKLKYGSDWGITRKDPQYGKLTPQAISAQKIRELYLWWIEIRPNRPEPMKAAGLNWDETKEENLFGGKVTRKELSEFKKLEKIEKSYDDEDTKMLLELIKIRKEIWT
ncbi:MAG: hypothetical protein EBZ58_08940 [Bacteroidetes bacterium]|nr:hypothetical protein [Bacteroidota bacterium]